MTNNSPNEIYLYHLSTMSDNKNIYSSKEEELKSSKGQKYHHDHKYQKAIQALKVIYHGVKTYSESKIPYSEIRDIVTETLRTLGGFKN